MEQPGLRVCLLWAVIAQAHRYSQSQNPSLDWRQMMAKKMRIEEISPGNREFATIVLKLELVLNSMQTNTKIRAFTFFFLFCPQKHNKFIHE